MSIHIGNYIGKHVHMIGVGGSSMSGLAEMLLEKGCIVSGSDRSDSYLLNRVRRAGGQVMVGQKAEQVHGADLVVYTAAIARDNPERAEAERLGIPMMERSLLLGQLMGECPEGVAICGAHGKTTATSMLTQMLMRCNMDPSIHIGGQLDIIGGSTRIGHSGIFLAEACEFNRSFLDLRPTVAAVLNIDADHLDCYKDIDEIEETFGQFLHLLPENGLAIGRGTDERVVRQLKRLTCRTQTFGLSDSCDWHPVNLRENELGNTDFDLYFHDQFMAAVHLGVPGLFNTENCLAAFACAHELGADLSAAAAAMADFSGAHRRFEKTDEIGGVEIFHDYGHNPAEMRNALSIGRKRARNRLIAVMQPHTFSRVKTLFSEYLTCTEAADLTLVTDICAAREKDPGDINSGMLVEGMRQHGINAVLTPSFDDTEAYLRSVWQPGDLVLTMGCGDINLLNDQIHRHEEEKNNA